MGFDFSHRPGYPSPTRQPFVVKAGTTDLSGGVFGNIVAGEVAKAATADTAIAGLVIAAVNPDHNLAALPAGAEVYVITDPDAIYRVTDANAREFAATLDIGAGGKIVAASVNADLVVTAKSTSAQATHVRIANTQHPIAKV